jgi:hypothetical protein
MPYAVVKAHHEELVSSGVVFNQWQYPLLEAVCQNPGGCCYGFFCTPCFAYQQRERILENLQKPYRPCGGMFCCCPTPEITDSPARECCLCCEVWCCPYLATLVNRDLVMFNYRVDFDQCDEFIITCVVCMDCVVGILAAFDERFQALKDLVDLLLLIIMSCSLAQQESQLDVVTGVDTCTGGNYATKAGVSGGGKYQRLPNQGQPVGGGGQGRVGYA